MNFYSLGYYVVILMVWASGPYGPTQKVSIEMNAGFGWLVTKHLLECHLLECHQHPDNLMQKTGAYCSEPFA